ncbi:hypothetical protein QMT40_003463 [Parvibaculaceae bacterium PLY_AMNH_Bact1]|nr:hypothetical protein QMT40_003463 [Parvibaculaceae bacterium PLY_AMNH_Bact1]
MGWIRDIKNMIEDLQRVSPFMRVWGPLLNAPMVLGGVVFINRFEAVLILVSCVGSVAVAAQIHKRVPFTRLSSLVHVVWLPLFPYLVQVLMDRGAVDLYSAWLAFVTLTMGICPALDALNIGLYLSSSSNKYEGADR